MPTNRPDPKVTPDRTADADATAPPDPTQPGDASALTFDLGARPYPFLSPPTRPDDLGSLGPYRVVKLLGEGGMGFVFRGEDDALRRPVTLKVMRPEVAAGENARERFLREGRAAAAVKSDHVITIYQVGEANGVPFLAMEFLAGATLDDWLKGRGGSAPAAAIVKVAKDTLRGLGAAHDRGLIHRDIKPANLWLEAGTGRVKVLDFGLTRGSDDVLTREGALVGTPSYMAPEQAAGRAIDPRADLFSVGVVLYRMAAGRNPFQRGDVWATLTALAVDVPPPAGSVAAGLPAGLGELIDRLVAKNAAARPESARAALAELAEVERAMKGGTAAGVPVVNVPVVYAPPAAAEPNPWAAVTEAVTEVERDPVPAPVPEPTKLRPERRSSKMPLIAGLVGLAVVAAGGVGLALVMRGDPEVTKTNPPEEKGTRPPPTPKPPEELLVPAAGPVVKAGPSPFDALDPAKIPAAERVAWLPKETVAVLGGHRGDTRGWEWGRPIQFSPDGKWFVAASGNTVSVYDAATLDMRWHEPNVLQGVFAISPDGKRLGCGCFRPDLGGYGVRVIDLTRAVPRVVKDLAALNENGTKAIAFGHDGKTLVTGTGFGGIYVWNLDDPVEQQPAKVVRAGVESTDRVVFQLWMSRDGKRLVEGRELGGKRTAAVWDTDGPKQVGVIDGTPGIGSLVVSPQEDRLVVLRPEGTASTLEVWRIDGPEPKRVAGRLRGEPWYCHGPFTPDGRQVLLTWHDRSEMWDVGDDRLAKARALPTGVVAVTPDLSRTVKAEHGRFRVLDRDGKAVVEPGEQVATGLHTPVGTGGRVYTFTPVTRAWSVRDGALSAEDITTPDDNLAWSLMSGATTSADGRLVAGLGADMVVRVFAVEPTGLRRQTRILADQGAPAGRFSSFEWHPDGKRIVTPHEDGSAGVWDVTAEPATRKATWPKCGPQLRFAPTGDVLADFLGYEENGPVGLRRPGTAAAVRAVPGMPTEATVGAVFAPDGRSLYVGTFGHDAQDRLRRFDLTRRQPTGEVVVEKPAGNVPGGPFHGLAFSRDGKRLLGYTRTRVYVLDVESRGTPVARAVPPLRPPEECDGQLGGRRAARADRAARVRVRAAGAGCGSPESFPLTPDRFTIRALRFKPADRRRRNNWHAHRTGHDRPRGTRSGGRGARPEADRRRPPGRSG